MYWIELLNKTDFITENQFESINEDAIELMKLITRIIITAKKTLIVNR